MRVSEPGQRIGEVGAQMEVAKLLARQPGGLAHLGSLWLARNLDRRLDLTADQRRQVDAILADTARDAAALRRDITPRLLEILDRTHRRIAAVLTPEQRKK